MAYPVFVPPINPQIDGAEAELQADILQLRMGDGYTVRQPRGLNFQLVTNRLLWGPLTTAQRNQMLAFFRERGGHKPFYYAVPHDVTRQYIATNVRWSAMNFDLWTLSAVLTETFDPEF